MSLRVVVRRPGWSAWALGRERHEHLTVQTPVAHILDRWPAGAHPRIVQNIGSGVEEIPLAFMWPHRARAHFRWPKAQI